MFFKSPTANFGERRIPQTTAQQKGGKPMRLWLVVSLASLSLCEGAFAQNLTETFDRALTGWSSAVGTAEWSSVDSSGLSTSGSAKLTNRLSVADNVSISRCLVITPPFSSYVAGGRARLGDGLTTGGDAQLNILFFTSSDCTSGASDGVNIGLASGTPWTRNLFVHTFSPARTDIHSVLVSPALYKFSNDGVVTAYFDDLLFGIDAAASFAHDRLSAGVAWKTEAGQIGLGSPIELTADSSYFWFFAPTNVELVMKVLDACTFNDSFWVFAGGLTNVETYLTVVENQGSHQRTYFNAQGTAFQPVQDTGAFPICP
jgi:hypothetical protein